MPDGVRLVVDGKSYGGWKSIRVTLSIRSLSGSFDLDVSDRWGGQEVPWPIREEDACRVEIDGETVIDGYVDDRDHNTAATQRRLGYGGRDRSAALVDCSAVLKSWSFSKVTVVDLARKLAAPFGVPVSTQAGLTLKQEDFSVNPGEKVYEALQRAAVLAGVLLVSDRAGGLIVTRAGTERLPIALVEGGPLLLGAAVKYDGKDRYHRYVIGTQHAGKDWFSGAPVAGVHAEALDFDVRRTSRVLYIRPETGMTAELARRRVDWEARVRAAKAETVTLLVRGWRQPSGELWPVNKIAPVRAPTLIGVEGDLLIAETEFSLGEGGQVTQLQLVRPDAFLPEPKAVVKGTGAWKELKAGVK